ncbi:sigma 54-interacting transcriptional regulator, partial [bacterium]|nr:sigma 54-interacting transcriptional regulator [bacterium]
MEKLLYKFDDIITSDRKMLEIIEKAKKVAGSYINLLITGENGTGKNMLAQAIHTSKGANMED